MPISNTSLIPLANPDSYGPAMACLTDNQKRFVIAMLETGGRDAKLAAGMAGYGGTDGARGVRAFELSHHEGIQRAMKEEADKRLRGGAILAASVMIEIASDQSHKDRFKAADRLLAATGLNVENVSRHIIEDHRKDDELEAAILLMAKKHGIDPAKLLGSKAPENVIDAEFTEVEGSMEGLEDLM